jgi:hypothetical protein
MGLRVVAAAVFVDLEAVLVVVVVVVVVALRGGGRQMRYLVIRTVLLHRVCCMGFL